MTRREVLERNFAYLGVLAAALLATAGIATLDRTRERVVAQDSELRAAAAARPHWDAFAAPRDGIATFPRVSGAPLSTFVRALAGAARDTGTRVVSIAPDGSEIVPARAGWTGVAYAVEARGAFRHVLRFVQTLPQRGALVDVRRLELKRIAPVADADPPLETTIHLALYRAVTAP